jgi:drug/metabolite transporter (DMT)-like permease
VTSSPAGRWLLLALLWSLQYILMRIAVPVFGTGIVAESRALFAAAFLVPWVLLVTREPLMLGRSWRDHLAVCMVNNVLPFICFAYAATALPASYLAVMNGMVPLWSAVISVPVLKEPLSASRIVGFLLGIAGITLIVKLGPIELTAHTALAAAAGMAGAAFWGWAGVVIRQRTGRVPPISLAAGSIIFAAALLAPTWVAAPALSAWTPGATAALVALGALVSGVAYLPFFTLVRDIGSTQTLTVGLAVPVLGMLWGWLFLGETITASMLAGAALVLAALVTVMKRQSALRRAE